MKRASDSERKEYKGVYPLYGWTKIGDHQCAVEDLRGVWATPDPIYEIIAPKGFHFSDDGDSCDCALHTMLCASLSEVKSEAENTRIYKCESEIAEKTVVDGYTRQEDL